MAGVFYWEKVKMEVDSLYNFFGFAALHNHISFSEVYDNN